MAKQKIEHISFANVFGFGWYFFTKYLKESILVGVIIIVLYGIFDLLFPPVKNPGFFTFQAILSQVLYILVVVIEGLFIYYITQREQKKKESLGSLFKHYNIVLPRLVGLELLFGAMLFGGFVLLVIPGLWVLVVFEFAYYYVILENKKITDAFKLSMNVTRGNRMNILLFTVVSFVVLIPFEFVFGKLPISLHVSSLIPGMYFVLAHFALWKELERVNPTK